MLALLTSARARTWLSLLIPYNSPCVKLTYPLLSFQQRRRLWRWARPRRTCRPLLSRPRNGRRSSHSSRTCTGQRTRPRRSQRLPAQSTIEPSSVRVKSIYGCSSARENDSQRVERTYQDVIPVSSGCVSCVQRVYTAINQRKFFMSAPLSLFVKRGRGHGDNPTFNTIVVFVL